MPSHISARSAHRRIGPAPARSPQAGGQGRAEGRPQPPFAGEPASSFEPPRGGAGAPAPAQIDDEASAARLGAVGAWLDALGGHVDRALAHNRLSEALVHEGKEHLGPPIDSVAEHVEHAVARVGGSADHVHDALARTGESLEAKTGLHGVGAAVRALGAVVGKLFGTETLRHTSFAVGGGVRMNLPVVNVNGGVFGSQYFPSLALAEKEGSYAEALTFTYGASVASPLGGVGWNNRGRASGTVNLVFVSASFDSKAEMVFVGVPGIFGVVVGKDVDRGSYVNVGGAAPLSPLWIFGPLLVGGLTLHTPLLDGLNRVVTRPVARSLVRLAGAIGKGVKRALPARSDEERRARMLERLPADPRLLGERRRTPMDVRMDLLAKTPRPFV